MAKILVDTDVVIEVMKGKQKIAENMKALWRRGNAIFCCPITVAEVYHGLRIEEMGAAEGFFTAVKCLPITEEAGRKAGEYLAKYHKSYGVELGDALVAAACFLNKALLYTINKKHYPMKDIRMVEKEIAFE